MAVMITPQELAGALDRAGISSPEMSSKEPAECLLVDAILTRLQEKRVQDSAAPPARDLADA